MSESSNADSADAVGAERIPNYRAKLPALPPSSFGSSFPQASRSAQASQSAVPKSIGKFELLEVVGRGAFGIVYRARDRDLDRIVAVKVPKNGQFVSQEEEDRFVREARSVAQLSHPGIVHIHEVGHTGQLPYLVSDFVEGLTLRDLLHDRRLQVDESADIAASISESLAHAHSRGVVHRDIKPANVMMARVEAATDEVVESTTDGSRSSSRRRETNRMCGRPRLMDFGLSRRDIADATVTKEGQLLGTPAYMSPEQARGETAKIDVRSDIYSVGVVLYEMLTGELPFRGSSRMVVQQVIMDEPTSPRRLVSDLPIDLETICLKCLEKDPARRYQTSGELAAELYRYLNGQPILARPISSLSRGWRWCERNPVVSALLAMLFVSMLLGLAGVTTQWRRAERNADVARIEATRASSAAQLASSEALCATTAAEAERRSRRQAEQAEARAENAAAESAKQAETARRVSDFMVGIFQGADRLGVRGKQFGQFGSDDRDPTARQLLDRGMQLIETELQNEPEIRATVMATIAETYASLGSVKDTDRVAKKTIEILRDLHGDSPNELTADMLGLLAVARYAEGNYEASLPLGRQAIAIYDELHGEMDPRGATTKLFFGMILLESNIAGDVVDEAIAVFNQVLAIRRAQSDPDPTEIALALVGKAITQRVRGENFPAIMTLMEANRSLGDDAEAGKFVRIAMLAVNATVAWQAGQPEKAKQQTEQLIRESTELLGPNHPIVTYVTMDQASRMMQYGDFDEGEELMLKGIAASRRQFGRQPRTAKGLFHYGRLLVWSNKKLDTAVDVLSESAEIYAEVLGDQNPRTQQSLKTLASALDRLDRKPESQVNWGTAELAVNKLQIQEGNPLPTVLARV